MSRQVILVVFVVSVVATILLSGWLPFLRRLEITPPRISITELPRGIGTAPVRLGVELQDDGSGLSGVSVVVATFDTERAIERQTLGGVRRHRLEIPLSGKELNLPEGRIRLIVSARNNSIWRSITKEVIELSVDYTNPKLVVVAAPRVVSSGSAALIFFTALDEQLVSATVRVGDRDSFPTSVARLIDRDFVEPSLFVGLFTVPSSLPPGRARTRLVAEDGVGNVASLEVPLTVVARPSSRVPVTVGTRFVNEFLPTVARTLPGVSEPVGSESVVTAEGRAALFRLVFNDVLSLERSSIANALPEGRLERLWNGQFRRPIGTVVARPGDIMNVVLGKEVLGTFSPEHEVIALQGRVTSANDGVVVAVGRYGAYRTVVAVDHGLGLTSLYGNLASAAVSVGQRVSAGAVLGEPEVGPFSESPTLFYELRLQGQSLTTADWSDEVWYRAEIESRIAEAKRAVGIPVYERLR